MERGKADLTGASWRQTARGRAQTGEYVSTCRTLQVPGVHIMVGCWLDKYDIYAGKSVLLAGYIPGKYCAKALARGVALRVARDSTKSVTTSASAPHV